MNEREKEKKKGGGGGERHAGYPKVGRITDAKCSNAAGKMSMSAPDKKTQQYYWGGGGGDRHVYRPILVIS